MNDFIIETTRPNASSKNGQEIMRWIGIRMSVLAMIEALPGYKPSVVDGGPEVLK